MGNTAVAKGPMLPSLDIARRLQTEDFSPFEFSKTFGTSLESATRIVKVVGAYYGPNGKGEQAFAKFIRSAWFDGYTDEPSPKGRRRQH
jgi:hypothetical protein